MRASDTLSRDQPSITPVYTSANGASLGEPGNITLLLRQWNGGESAALDPLFDLVYPQLKRIAEALFRGERPGNVLQPTGLVNEVYLKLIRQRVLHFEDRQHFYSLSARMMRRVLIDQARLEGRQKRKGGVAVPLHEELAWVDAASSDILDLDQQLNELEQIDPRKCRMVELHFFLGFTSEETAEMLGISKATADRDLKFVRAWLYDRLRSSEP
jgi:RNA polymerase sigma factor (TIGR02999 family)